MDNEDEIKNIPDNNFFAVQGINIKQILRILRVIKNKDRNTLIHLSTDFDAKKLYDTLIDSKEVKVLDKNNEVA
ncbi:MAG: hypothetical protein QW478_07770 [Candidatus Micrarchaeaceae archaeon]